MRIATAHEKCTILGDLIHHWANVYGVQYGFRHYPGEDCHVCNEDTKNKEGDTPKSPHN